MLELLIFGGGAAAGCVVIGAVVLIARRKARKKKKRPMPQLMQEPDEEIQEPTPTVQRMAPNRNELPEIVGLDEAVQGAVKRALLESNADIEITLDFPEKCKLFGEVVTSKGTVTIHRSGDKESQEMIRTVGRHVNEVEEAVEKRMSEIEAKLKAAPKADAMSSIPGRETSEQDDECEEGPLN